MSELRFDGQVAIVTGAGGGLGRAHALLLAERGAAVVVNDLGGSVHGDGSDAGPAQSVVDEILAAGGRAVADAHDISTVDGGRAVVDRAIGAFGRVDVVVNNAGILRNRPFEEMTDEALEPVLAVHVLGAFHVTRPAWAYMIEQGSGRIVNTTSAAGLLGNSGMTNYGTAKGGIYGLTRVLAIEGAKHGIRVNAIAPMAATRMLTESMDAPVGITDRAAMAQMQQIAVALDPAYVSAVVAYLAHPECSVTGEVYTVGGGQVARLFLGHTRGIHDVRLSPESVRDRLDAIRDQDGYTVPRDTADESQEVFARIAAG